MNAPAPSSPASTPTPISTQTHDTPASAPQPLEAGPSNPAELGASSTQNVEMNPPSTPLPSTGKRKVRSSRTVGEDGGKRAKFSGSSSGKEKDYTPPTVLPSDMGGVDAAVDLMRELVIMPIKHPEVYLHIGVQPVRGILLHGPPGCGKTLLAHAIAGVSSDFVFSP